MNFTPGYAVICHVDEHFHHGQPFYDFVMTTSIRRPYTYPAGKINIRPGSGRDGGVRYTDYAIGRFIDTIKNKPWFNNIVIIFVADHCASSAGKNQVNVGHYQFPCIIYNLQPSSPIVMAQCCSQIDLYPTLFGLPNWSYQSNFYGKNVLLPAYTPRAFVATCQQLGYLQNDSLVILGPHQKVDFFKWDKKNNEQFPLQQAALLAKTVSYYQSAYYLFKHEGMKSRNWRREK